MHTQAPDQCSFCATIHDPAARRPSSQGCSEFSRRSGSPHHNLTLIECSLWPCQNNNLPTPPSLLLDYPSAVVAKSNSRRPSFIRQPRPLSHYSVTSLLSSSPASPSNNLSIDCGSQPSRLSQRDKTLLFQNRLNLPTSAFALILFSTATGAPSNTIQL